MLDLKRTLWVGVKFCIANGKMAQYMHRMMPKHVIAPDIGSIITRLSILLGTMVQSPLEF